MQAKDRRHRRIVESAGFDQELSATHRLLRRLEQELHRSGQLPAQASKDPGGAQQDGGVHIMAAGVHLARDPRLVGHVLGILDRQAVEVRAQRHRDPFRGARDRPQHSGAADAVLVFDAQLVEDRLHSPGGAVLLQPELRMAVQIPADLHHPRQDLTGGGEDFSRLDTFRG